MRSGEKEAHSKYLIKLMVRSFLVDLFRGYRKETNSNIIIYFITCLLLLYEKAWEYVCSGIYPLKIPLAHGMDQGTY